MQKYQQAKQAKPNAKNDMLNPYVANSGQFGDVKIQQNPIPANPGAYQPPQHNQNFNNPYAPNQKFQAKPGQYHPHQSSQGGPGIPIQSIQADKTPYTAPQHKGTNKHGYMMGDMFIPANNGPVPDGYNAAGTNGLAPPMNPNYRPINQPSYKGNMVGPNLGPQPRVVGEQSGTDQINPMTWGAGMGPYANQGPHF